MTHEQIIELAKQCKMFEAPDKHGQLARSCNVCELEAEVERQASEIERRDALLRQALGALSDLAQDTQHEDHNCGDAEWCPVLHANAAIAAIKQHLGEQT